MLQSSSFPAAPTPTTTIADVLQLNKLQRFDLMAIPSSILDKRCSGAGQIIIDVRLVDGSKDPRSTATEPANATMPLTLFFKNNSEFESFEGHVGRSPILFMALSGNVADNKEVKVTSIKNISWWQPSSGHKHDAMTAQAQTLCDTDAPVADVVSLPTFVPQENIDYTNVPATLTACSLLDLKVNHGALLGDATEHLYQLNHVYVTPPTTEDKIIFEDRLFGVFDCWDYSKKIQVGFRAKAMLSLAGLEPTGTAEEYQTALASGGLRHPVLASVRVRVKRKTEAQSAGRADATEHSQTSNDVSTVVVEAEPLNLAEAPDIPNDSVEAIHGLLAAGSAPTSERLVATTLEDLKPSPFYNMVIRGEPSDKALVLLQFSQRSLGAQISNGFRLATDNVKDACDAESEKKYGAIACCTIEKSPDFTAAGKGSLAFAVICKVVSASKPQHTVEFYIESMEPVVSDHRDRAVATIKQLQRVASVESRNATASTEAAWQQRKCRRLQRYPTMM